MSADSELPQNQDTTLIARGDLLLKQLAEEAAAARAEARHAELQRLMNDARKGNVAPLEKWLDDNSPAEQPIADSQPVRQNADVAQASHRLSWEDMRAPALARLRERFPGESQVGLGGSNSAGDSARQVKAGHDVNRKQIHGSKPNSIVAELAADPKSAPFAVSRGKSQSPSAGKTAKELKKLAVTIGQGDEQAEDRQASRKRGALFSRLSGAATSAIAHVVLVAVLALITLQAPKAPAGMSFDAATSPTEENVELTQPVDIETPETAEPTTETEVSADFDFADTIEAAAPADSLGDLGPVGDALSPSALSSAMQTMSPSSMSSASFFGASAGGNCFCYVIDGSGSMRDGPWEAAKFELFKSLDSLSSKQRFYIIFFGRDFEAITMPGEREPASRALYATAENVGHAKKWVNGLEFVPGGPPIEAIEFAIEKEPDAIYLLTDGVTSVKTVAQEIRAANVVEDLINGEQVRSTIHAISFYSLKGEQLMRQIASDNKGQFIYVPDPRKR